MYDQLNTDKINFIGTQRYCILKSFIGIANFKRFYNKVVFKKYNEIY